MSESAPERFFDSAKQLSINTSKTIINNTVSHLDISDLYSFNLKGRSSFKLQLEDLSADVDVRLIKDKNGNGEFDEGEKVAYSNNWGKSAESININLVEGDYYIQVYSYDYRKTDYRLSVLGVPFDNAGNTFNNGRQVILDSQTKSFKDWVGKVDSKDYYQFKIDNTSIFEASVDDLTNDADLRLLNSEGNILRNSANLGARSEVIAQPLEPGTYYIEVSSYYNSETYYNLNLSASPIPQTQAIPTSPENPTADSAANQSSSPIAASASIPQNANNTRTQAGSLRADLFTYQPGYTQTIFSGNGNIDYGSGALDLIDLSDFDFASVTSSYAKNENGGEAYNPGNGFRIFDVLFLPDNSKILFENIDAIKYKDGIDYLSTDGFDRETQQNPPLFTNDPKFKDQWNLHVMGVHNAWQITTGSDAVILGIQDSGLATNSNGVIHEDLHGIINANTDPNLPGTYVIGDNYKDDSSNFSHGTSVQGTIAAKSNNGIGIAGINWNSRTIHLDVIVDGNGDDYNLADATQAMINQANALNKVLVVNLSLAGGYSQQFENLIANNQEKVLFVIAAGNHGGDSIASPANLAQNYNNVIAVGASWGTKDYYGNDKEPGERIFYESWWGSATGTGLTIMAPSEFTSTSANSNGSGSFDFDYNTNFNGTSASTPNVSGVASLIWSVNPQLTATDIKQIISQTAYDLGNPGYDTTYGHGLINADAAVRRASAIARGYA